MNPGGSSEFGVQGGMEIDPGSMGQIDSSGPQAFGNSDGYGQGTFEDEPPLLQELGIDFELIKEKVCPCTDNQRAIPVIFPTFLCDG